MVVQKVPRLPRKSSLRCRKCHACHAKDRGATSVLLRRQASADIYDGTESTTPATQIEPEVPKVPRLPRKRPWRHISPTSSPSFRSPLWWYRKYHACHANRAWGAESFFFTPTPFYDCKTSWRSLCLAITVDCSLSQPAPLGKS